MSIDNEWLTKYLDLVTQLKEHLAKMPHQDITFPVNPPTWPEYPSYPSPYQDWRYLHTGCGVCGQKSEGADLYCCMNPKCPSRITYLNVNEVSNSWGANS